MGKLAAAIGLVLLAGTVWGDQPVTATSARTAESFKKEIVSLISDKVAWREIAWKSCLLEGLKESRDKNKPLLLWVFIDRPADDARC